MDELARLRDAIGTVAERIRGYHSREISPNEENTKLKLINPVLRALGWDEQGDDLELEYRDGNDNPVDYALRVSQKLVLFLEAKALGLRLDEDKPTDQVQGYALRAGGVSWCVLTDGDRYHLYKADSRILRNDRLFRETRISEDADDAAQVLGWLSRENMQDQTVIEARWKEHYANQQVLKAIKGMVKAGDHGLVELISKKVRLLDSEEIADAMRRVVAIYPDAPADARLLQSKLNCIEVAILQVTGQKPMQSKETDQKYRTRLAITVNDMPNADWDKLCKKAQAWYTAAAKACNNDEALPDFNLSSKGKPAAKKTARKSKRHTRH